MTKPTYCMLFFQLLDESLKFSIEYSVTKMLNSCSPKTKYDDDRQNKIESQIKIRKTIMKMSFMLNIRISFSTDINALQHPPSRRLISLRYLCNYIGQVQHHQASAHAHDGCEVPSVCACVYVPVFVDKCCIIDGIFNGPQ